MKRISAFLTIILIILLSFSWLRSANAEIFKWTDDKGGIHFTEDPAMIPEKYREKVNQRTTEEDLMTPEERLKAKERYDMELQERQQKGKKEDQAKEQEKQAEKQRKELIKRVQEAEGRCEIISYSQYEMLSDVFGSSDSVASSKRTCVEIAIQNNSYQPKTIQSRNIIAFTQKGNRANPREGLFIRIDPGQTHQGNICFRNYLSTIVRMELQGL